VSRRHGLATLALCAVLACAGTASAKGPSKAECIRANESAQDLQGQGKLREARTQLAACVAATCPGAVRQDCAQRLSDVESKIPTLVLEVKTASGDDATGVRVLEDGAVIAEKLGGTALELDPGEHRLTFEADGQPSVTKTFALHEGEKGRRERVILASSTPVPLAGEPAAASTQKADSEMQRSPYADHPDEGSTGTGQRTAGLVFLGGGVVAVGIGTAFALSSKSTYDHALSSECNNDANHCSPQGATDGDTAHSQATFSTIAFIAGGALLATGALLYFTAPRAPVSVEATAGGLRLRGSW
jgi:hypothetical protein